MSEQLTPDSRYWPFWDVVVLDGSQTQVVQARCRCGPLAIACDVSPEVASVWWFGA